MTFQAVPVFTNNGDCVAVRTWVKSCVVVNLALK